jgi:glycogen debranching enzyme
VAEPLTSSATPDTVTLVEGSSFGISLRSGDMLAGHPHGLFYRDTRFLSQLRLRVNGDWPESLAVHGSDPFSAVFVLRACPQPGQAEPELVLFRHRHVGTGMREDLVVRNYGEAPALCHLELLLDCDFADLFEVKEGRVRTVGDHTVSAAGSEARFDVTRGPFRRSTILQFSEQPRFDEGRASYEVTVPARGEWSTCIEVVPVIDDQAASVRYPCGTAVEHAEPNVKLAAWRRNLPTITTSHDPFRKLLGQSAEDLAALRIFDLEYPDRPVVAAGAPWFMTLFGRDSLLTSWMAMLIDPDLALGTLQTLAHYQGREVNPLTEEEPGRILHEMRFGESSRLWLGAGNIYYGSVDATPLFVMALGELRRWGHRAAEVDALVPAADAALDWITNYGDRDGDGYVEYQRSSERGLPNQGWKDSWDAIRFASGRLAEAPIALCEVQAYVWAALGARAHFAAEAGDEHLASTLYARAADLKTRFNRDFWLEEQGWFAMGLDRDKQPIDALASNMGHCLWTGIVDAEKAPLIAKHLVGDECFSGWGVRTLASSMSGFNPISYHNGTIWPHDNAICAAGLMRYGLVDEAHRVMQGVVDAAGYFGDRLPELFGGFGRDEYPFPINYPTSCSPQAWAAASPLLFLRSMLRFEPDLRAGVLHLAPVVPPWVGTMRVEAIKLAGGVLSLEVEGEKLNVLEAPAGVEIVLDPLYGLEGERTHGGGV